MAARDLETLKKQYNSTDKAETAKIPMRGPGGGRGRGAALP